MAAALVDSLDFEDVRRLLEGSVDAAIVVDAQHRVLYHNAAYDAYAAKRPRQLAQLVESGTPCHALFGLEICERECLMRRANEVGRPLRMHEVRARRGDGAELTLIVTSTPIGDGLVVETYRDVTAESRLQRKYHTLLSRERVAKEELERQVGERTEALTRAQDQLVMNEKMSSLGRLVAGIAHELNNPINFVYGNVDFIADYFQHIIGLLEIYEASPLLPPEVRQAAERYKYNVDFAFLLDDWRRLLRSIRAGAERTAQIVAGLKTFSRPQVGPLEDADLIAGLETTLSLLAPVLRDITVERDFHSLPPVRCRAGQVQQVFMNLLTNAAHASGSGGSIYISARVDAEGATFVVRDSGPGVNPEVASKIFDPFFTTKEVGEGTGLGLAISQRIIRAHGGRIDLSPPSEAGGAEFTVWLPRHPTF